MGFKIVRDHQRRWSQEHGVSGQWRPSPDPMAALRKKLAEELGEYTEDHDPSELYDLMDVLKRLIRIADPECLFAARHAAKVRRLGVFEQLIEWSPVPSEVEAEKFVANVLSGRQPL